MESMETTGPTFTAIDFEAANSKKTSIISIGYACVRGGYIHEAGSWLVDPGIPAEAFDPYAMHIHGITPDLVEGALGLEASMKQLLAIIGDDTVLAHNAGYERAALITSARAAGLKEPKLQFRCTQKLAAHTLKLKNPRLSNVAKHLGLPEFEAHDAGADALTTARIGLQIADRHRAGDIDALYKKLGIA